VLPLHDFYPAGCTHVSQILKENAMKRLSLTSITRSALIACALAIGVFASTPTAKAQSGSIFATVNISFAFQIGNQQMPAGLYQIVDIASNMLLLRGPGRAAGIVVTHPTTVRTAPTRGYVLFDRIGDAYFLRGLWSANNHYAMECFPGLAEKEMLRASKKPAPGLTTLALNSSPLR
jgi:hypothetical protein